MEVKFGVAKAVKQVKTSGGWFIAWGIYSKQLYMYSHIGRKNLTHMEPGSFPYLLPLLSFPTLPLSTLTGVFECTLENAKTSYSQTRALLKTSSSTGSTQLELGVRHQLKVAQELGRSQTTVKTNPVTSGMPATVPKCVSKCRHKHICANCRRTTRLGNAN